jgi:phytoene dehydrogenase-like protein
VASNDYDVIVVGGGHNGLVCAGYLARAGMRVLVLERRDVVGGACFTDELFPGYHFNTCAQGTSLLHPKITHDLELRKYGVKEIVSPDPSFFRPFPDGRHFFFWREEARTVEEIRRHSKHDAAAFPKFNALWRRVIGIFAPYLLSEPPTLAEVFARVRGTDDEQLLETFLTKGRADILEDHFELDILKAALVRSNDIGDPRAPGSGLPYMSECLEVPEEYESDYINGFPIGGVGVLTQAMAQSAASKGATIRTGVEVARVLVDRGVARGVVLTDGTEITSKLVVSNADPKRTFLRLVGPENLDANFVGRVRRLRTRAAYFKFHASLRELPDFSHYLGRDYDPKLICRFYLQPSIDAYEQAWRDAVNGYPSRRPIMSVQIASIYDRTIVPPGRHLVNIFAHYAPTRLAEGTWDDWRERVGENIINLVTEYAPNFRDTLIDWVAVTPADLERQVYLTDGNIHHIDLSLNQMLAGRPLPGWSSYTTPVENLWLCGAGTHPGGEVSGAPGHNAAHAILGRLG